MPHVVLITNTGWSMFRHRGEQIRDLTARGWKVSAIALYQNDEEFQVRRLGATTYNLSCSGSGSNVRKNLTYLLKLTGILRRLKPDVVHSFSIQAGVWGSLAARALWVPRIVCTITGSGYLVNGRSRAIQRTVILLARLALSKRVAVIFQNREGIEDFINERILNRDQCFYLPGCGVDIGALVPNFKRPKATFVMVSRMMWSKGVQPFIEAAKLVKAQHPEAQFLLIGGSKDDYAEQNSDFIDAAWLWQASRQGPARWIGRVSGGEAERAMASATAVVLLSTYGEGVPRVLIEAAALGSPIITTDAPGCRDVVTDDVSGFLCGTIEQASEAMVRLINNANLVVSMGKAGRALSKNFDASLIMAATMKAYEGAEVGASTDAQMVTDRHGDHSRTRAVLDHRRRVSHAIRLDLKEE